MNCLFSSSKALRESEIFVFAEDANSWNCSLKVFFSRFLLTASSKLISFFAVCTSAFGSSAFTFVSATLDTFACFTPFFLPIALLRASASVVASTFTFWCSPFSRVSLTVYSFLAVFVSSDSAADFAPLTGSSYSAPSSARIASAFSSALLTIRSYFSSAESFSLFGFGGSAFIGSAVVAPALAPSPSASALAMRSSMLSPILGI